MYVKGIRDSQTFPTKREATAWGHAREAELLAGQKGESSKTKTTHQAFDKYAEEVSPSKDGERWEVVRLAKFKVDFPLVTMDRLTPEHVKGWRTRRLSVVKPASVLREMKLLNSVFEQCRKEWKWLSANPCKDVERPESSRHREVVIAGHQIRRMLRALGFPARESSRHAVAHAFLLALVTGMREGELAKLTWANVKPRFVHLPKTKNGKPRNVPLSKTAVRVIERMRGYHDIKVFGVTAGAIDAQFRQARERAGLAGFTFHDSRHTAATRIGMSGKLNLQQLCAMFGWSDPKMAMVYFNPTAGDIAELL